MNRTDYLALMTQTYFNTFDECFEDVDFLDFPLEYRKNQFVKLIEQKQKSIKKDFDISLNDFIEGFKFALTFLDGQIASNIHEKIKKSSESELNDIRNNDLTIYVPLQKLNSSLTGIVCQKDVDYIKICFDSFVSQPKKPDAEKTDGIQKNPHETIFKDDFAFALFEKMKGIYSNTSTSQADYSFLFDIMRKEGFVICTGIKFIEFLSNFDISITKIDSSKTGNKQKTTIYNSIKENLLEKHGLSTI